MTLPSYVKFYRGTPESFNKLKYKDNDTLYGITYIRMSNIFNLERDFLYQYYSLIR